MAQVFARVALNLATLNLNAAMAASTSVSFQNNVGFRSHFGTIFEDLVNVAFNDGAAGIARFGGTGLSFDAATGAVTGGTLTGFQQERLVGSSYVVDWALGGVSTSAAAFYAAARTAGNGDERTILAKLLAGADSFDLSDQADLANGYAGNDSMKGDGGKDTLYGGFGNDTLYGGVGADTLYGGLGNDRYYVDNAGDRTYEFSSDTAGIDSVYASVSRSLGSNLENLVLTGSGQINGAGNGQANSLYGNVAANRLDGAAGVDRLSGGAGNDTLVGGAGADLMYGGLGNDRYFVDNVGDRTTETAADPAGIDTVYSSVSRSLGTNLERLVLTGAGAINGSGNTQNNVITGNAGANRLNGGTGADSMFGGLGNDRYVVDNVGDRVYESSAGGGIDTVFAGVGRSLGLNQENLVLTGNLAINGTGNALDNLITGNAAANQLSGGTGADTMIGGLGNDRYYVDNSADVVTETSSLASEIDIVYASVGHSLGEHVERLALTGTNAINGQGNELDNVITGNSASNGLSGGEGDDKLSGKAGNDVLTGGEGDDTLDGGSGNDVYNIDSAGDVIIETSTLATETDSVHTSVSYTLSANLESMLLSGAAAIDGTGNGRANTIVGNSASNTIDGGAGDDTLYGLIGTDRLIGGEGNDKLRGGTGADTLTGGAGADSFRADAPVAGVVDVDHLVDFVTSVDRIELDDGGFSGIGAFGPLGAAAFHAGTEATDAAQRVVYDQATGSLYFDADGSGAGAQILFAVLDSKPVLDAADFYVI